MWDGENACSSTKGKAAQKSGTAKMPFAAEKEELRETGFLSSLFIPAVLPSAVGEIFLFPREIPSPTMPKSF